MENLVGTAFAEALIEVGDPPCNKCENCKRCGEDGLACVAFIEYVKDEPLHSAVEEYRFYPTRELFVWMENEDGHPPFVKPHHLREPGRRRAR